MQMLLLAPSAIAVVANQDRVPSRTLRSALLPASLNPP
jgi:hypothetical protein